MDYQRIQTSLIGNATHDAEIKTARASGAQYGDFRLAVCNRKGQTHFYPVRCFGKLAKGVSGISKGVKVFVDGEMEIDSFEGDDGQKRVAFRVVANTYRILGSGRRDAAQPE